MLLLLSTNFQNYFFTKAEKNPVKCVYFYAYYYYVFCFCFFTVICFHSGTDKSVLVVESYA